MQVAVAVGSGGRTSVARTKKPYLGMIYPIMGMNKSFLPNATSLANALFPRVRQRVLAVLFGTPDRSFYANEVIALAQSGTGAVQRELAGLSQAGLLTVSKQGNQKHYQANADAPVFAELRGVLRTALQPLAAQIEQAFVYGSVARQQDTANSDVDVMVVSPSLGYGELFGALEAATQTLGRKVNPTLYTPGDIAKRIREDNVFVTRVLIQPTVWLIGKQEELNVPTSG
jgi:predicted nucleotidyltransferase